MDVTEEFAALAAAFGDAAGTGFRARAPVWLGQSSPRCASSRDVRAGGAVAWPPGPTATL